jgi:hypothetical protein
MSNTSNEQTEAQADTGFFGSRTGWRELKERLMLEPIKGGSRWVADFHWKPVLMVIKGQLDFSAEWIWSDVSRATYDPTGKLGFGPTMFSNYRQGGYVSLCYRPTEVENKIIQNIEFCSRFDVLESSLASPGGEHESRVTLGVDYWLTPYCVLKTAYEVDQKKVGPNQNAFIIQLGYGL